MRVFSGMVVAALLTPTAQAQGVFEVLKANCGMAFEGHVIKAADDDPWRAAHLVMHIRDCSDTQVKVPLHYDDDRSRIWIVSKIDGDRLRLKHDHRHEDGASDDVTLYGGESIEGDGGANDPDVAFIVDEQSLQIFRDNGNTRSPENVWSMAVDGPHFIYGLVRPDLDFKVAFDLSQPIAVPPAAWDLVVKGDD